MPRIIYKKPAFHQIILPVIKLVNFFSQPFIPIKTFTVLSFVYFKE
jgi:hypothetical protein